MKRSLSSALARIWQGFAFHLEKPLNWQKHIGGSILGASMGVVARNKIDIQISKFHLRGMLLKVT